jgi:hypothetical protein
MHEATCRICGGAMERVPMENNETHICKSCANASNAKMKESSEEDLKTYQADVEFLHICICGLSAPLMKEAEKNLSEISKKEIMKQSFRKGVRTCLEYLLAQGDREEIRKIRIKQEESVRTALRQMCSDEKKIESLIKAMSSKDEEIRN